MKMRSEHYEHMKAAIGDMLARSAVIRTDGNVPALLAMYRQIIADQGKARDVDKRVRWDICYGSKLSGWISNNLYEYMDDTHIDTALRRIMRELEGGEGTRLPKAQEDDMRNAMKLAKIIVAEATLALPPGSTILEDKGQWTNRFEVRSESSDRVYIVSQHKEKGHWGCSCPGWRTRRKCKHLTSMGLPAFEVPHNVTIASRVADAAACKGCGTSPEGLGQGESLTPDGFCAHCDADRKWGAGDQRCSQCDGPWRRGKCMGSCPPDGSDAPNLAAIAGRVAGQAVAGRTRSFTPEQRAEVDAVLAPLVQHIGKRINAEASRIKEMDRRPVEGWTEEKPDVYFDYVAQAMLEDLIHDLQELV